MTMPAGHDSSRGRTTNSEEVGRKFCANCGHVRESHEPGEGKASGTMPKGMKAKPSSACILCFCSEFIEKKYQHLPSVAPQQLQQQQRQREKSKSKTPIGIGGDSSSFFFYSSSHTYWEDPGVHAPSSFDRSRDDKINYQLVDEDELTGTVLGEY
ncbi:MAG: hypothetical protein M3114_08150 [Thermoproteota archaeon]|nr:hypothetical protein [Thermoproteota archaeon]